MERRLREAQHQLGSADAAGDWWEPLIGPGKALDTDRIAVSVASFQAGDMPQVPVIEVRP